MDDSSNVHTLSAPAQILCFLQLEGRPGIMIKVIVGEMEFSER